MQICTSKGIPQIAPPNKDGRTRIIVPGGIGDVYWIMIKIEAFCKREGIKNKPQIIILSDPGTWESSRKRSIPFIEMIPFVEMHKQETVPMFPDGKRTKELSNMYTSLNREPIYKGFMGYEYFICYNGMINTGYYLEKDCDLECNWFLPLKISDHQEQYKQNCIKKHGKYAVFYFSMSGDFIRKNMAQFSLNKMANSINRFTKNTGLTPVFIGAWWDLKWPNTDQVDYLPILISKVKGAVNLVGQTTLDEAFGVMRGSEIVSGYHCGLTNMAIMFKKRTVLLWAPDRFPPSTPLAIAPPTTRNTSYIPLFTEGLTTDKYVGTMRDLLINYKDVQ